MKELSVIIPVYNEHEIISHVIKTWLEELREMKIDFELLLFNDGSTDETLEIINNVSKEHSEVVVFNKDNTGHGPTIIQGYLQSKSEWTFQIDSDNEISTDQFRKIWDSRIDKDFILGVRTNRKSPIPRKFVSYVSKLTVKVFYGGSLKDVNCPFRLFRTASFSKHFKKIPKNTFAPNVILSGIACKNNMEILEIPVDYKFRQTGEVSIKKWKLLKIAASSWWQTVKFSFKR